MTDPNVPAAAEPADPTPVPAAAAPAAPAPVDPEIPAPKILVLFLVCLFLGVLGIHRFMVGKIGTGLLMLFTLGGLGFWVIFDLIMLLTGNFTTKQGQKITEWT